MANRTDPGSPSFAGEAKMAFINIRLTASIKEAAEQAAHDDSRTLQSLIAKLLKDFLTESGHLARVSDLLRSSAQRRAELPPPAAGVNCIDTYRDPSHKTLLVIREQERNSLTGLFGRSDFLAILVEAIAKQGERALGLLLLNVHRLNESDDALGYEADDVVLQHLAAMISALPNDVAYTAARLSGDRFAILLDVDNVGVAVRSSEDIRSALRAPLHYRNILVTPSLSAGLAVFPEHAHTGEELFEAADMALHLAQTSASGRLVVYSRAVRAQQERRLNAISGTRAALIEDRLIPYYQPKVSLATGRVCGFEALLRLNDLELGLQSPATFAVALDHPDLAVAIGRMMQERAFRDIQRWRTAGKDVGKIALNASPTELLLSAYAHDFLERLDKHGIPPDSLEVEVTETALTGQGTGKIRGELQHLRSSGVGVFLDDFGTGYGSLIHLRQLPIHALKIDQSFIADAHTNDSAHTIVMGIIDLAKKLHLGVVAEGVETHEQAKVLVAAGCEVMQGYLFAKPMPAEQVSKFLENWDARAAAFRMVSGSSKNDGI